MIKKIFIFFTLLFSLFLCSCQANPESSFVTSKADGSFDASIIESSTAEKVTDMTLEYVEEFKSLDGSVTFRLSLNQPLNNPNMPVVMVSPHNITIDNAKKISSCLFGEAQLYEYNPQQTLTKSELSESIRLWSEYLSTEKITNLYGTSTEIVIASTKAAIQKYIEKYTIALENAPNTNDKTPCLWTFFPESHYSKYAENYNSNEKENQHIKATVDYNGYTYLYTVSNRDEDDFKINNIYVQLFEEPSPLNINSKIQKLALCKSPPPSESQVAIISDKAQIMLDSMCIGEWTIDECYFEPLGYGMDSAYMVIVKAVPVFNGVSVIRQNQLDNLTSPEVYASNYYYTDAEFRFAPNGVLLECTIMSPVDVVNIVNEDVKTISFHDLIEKAKTHFSFFDYHEYAQNIIYDEKEKPACLVNLDEIKYGLTRVKVPNTDDSYYYVPALTFTGDYQVYNKKGELQFDSRTYWSDENQTLLVLNAIDGTVINISNGF